MRQLGLFEDADVVAELEALRRRNVVLEASVDFLAARVAINEVAAAAALARLSALEEVVARLDADPGAVVEPARITPGLAIVHAGRYTTRTSRRRTA